MNEAQVQVYTNLPLAESCRLIDSCRAEVVLLESFPPQHVLTVTETEPFVRPGTSATGRRVYEVLGLLPPRRSYS